MDIKRADRKDILEVLKKMVAELTDVEFDIDENTYIKTSDSNRSLGLSSMDLVTLIVNIESRYDVQVAEETYFETIGDIITFIMENTAHREKL